MKKVLLVFMALLILAGAFLAGTRYNRPPTAARPQLLPAANDDSDGDLPPGSVKISPDRQQLLGVQVSLVEKKGTTHTIRTFGRVAVDENRIYRIITPSEGWLIDFQGGTTGSLVTKDQVLAKFSGRENLIRDIARDQQAFFLALNTRDRKIAENATEEQIAAAEQQVKSAERNLIAFGMSDTQIKEIARTRKPDREIEIRSPVTGVVLFRNVFPKFLFDRNTEFYRIADLSRVWILADAYENEAAFFKPGIQAKVTLLHQRKTFHAQVSKVLPLFDGASRTLKVRLELDNPGFTLRPDMFVDVEFPVRLPPAVIVPTDAVLDTGLKKTVFVDRGSGFFEPREVETGWRLGQRVEITKGLSPGEKIAVSGTFLIDSESRMDLAAAGMTGGLSKDPVCGLEVSTRKAEKAGRKKTYQGISYYFSSDECLTKFIQNPDRYLKKLAENPSPPPPSIPSNTPAP
jgi:RND family efflux transporter MFP subunit